MTCKKVGTKVSALCSGQCDAGPLNNGLRITCGLSPLMFLARSVTYSTDEEDEVLFMFYFQKGDPGPAGRDGIDGAPGLPVSIQIA